jgi:eukaryotic-like serine/threonine-protein kinase
MTVQYDSEIATTNTLGHRMAERNLSLSEALRYATLLAESLRQIHDSGRVCGTLQPSNVAVTDAGVEVILNPGEAGIVTPYTAPEMLQGHPADLRSDIFAFGAILHEMVTGRRAFAGDTPDALAVSLAISAPSPSGNSGLDHLVGNCTAKDPAVRCQRMQKVILELKLLSIAKGPEAVIRQQAVSAAVRAQAEKLETKVVALLESQEKALIDVQQSSGDSINQLHDRLNVLEAEVKPVQARSLLVEELCNSIMKHLEQVQQNVQSLDERVAGLKEQNDVLSQGLNVMQEYMGSRMHEFEQTLKSQRTSLASIVASQEQTDDVVEGMVSAMELVHNIVFERDETFQ